MAREYKDSGIEWIGQIPKEWILVPSKRLFSHKKQIVGEQVNDFERLALTMQGVIKRGKEDNEGLQPEKFDSYQILRTNELVFKLIDLANAKTSRVGLSPFTGIVSPAYIILRNSNPDNRFFYYWFLFMYYQLIFNQMGDDGVRSSLNADDVLNIPIPNISLPEQQKIADYLDKVCGEIDEMVALQETMIEELKAYKQSVITEAVTKGLNPNVPMRDSGIDWIGEVPGHWKLEPLKYCFGRRSEKNNPVKTEERLSLSIDKGVTLYSEKTTNLDRFKDDFTQYQLAYPNDIVLNCMNMIVGAVGLSNYMGCVSPVYYVIYPIRQDINPLCYSYLLNIPTIRGVYYSLGKGIYAIERGEGRVNTCRLKVAYNDFGRLEIPVPPIEEQKQITQFIQQKCSEIDSLIALKQAKIEELKEYKKSVIYEYVTGKKEVV